MSETRAPYEARHFVLLTETGEASHATALSEISARAKAVELADETGQVVYLLVVIDEFQPGGTVKPTSPRWENLGQYKIRR